MIQLDRESGVPLYLQIRNYFREQILSGVLPPGTRLPPERELAQTLGVTRGTVTNAYHELAADGLVEARVGRGTVVCSAHEHKSEEPERAPAFEWDQMLTARMGGLRERVLDEVTRYSRQPGTIALTSGIPDPALYPADAFHAAFEQASSELGAALYGASPIEGVWPLRQAVARLVERWGIATSPEEVLIVTGSQQGLDLITRLLVDRGDTVLVEAPTYLGALQVLERRGARLIGLSLDEEGVRLDLLEQALARYRPRFFYTIPTFHNPAGVTQGLERRKAVLDLTSQYGVPVVEDDPYGAFYFDSPPPPLLYALEGARKQVIYLGTFSKLIFPGLRLGWIVAPRSLIAALAALKRSIDLYCNTPLQWATATFCARGELDRHLERVRPLYARKMELAIEAFQRYAPQVHLSHPAGGFNLWARLPQGESAMTLLRVAAQHGVTFVPGEAFFADGGGHEFFRVCVSAYEDEIIKEGIRRLGKALQALQAERQKAEEIQPTGYVPLV